MANQPEAKVKIFLKGQEFTIRTTPSLCHQQVTTFLQQHDLPSTLHPRIIQQIQAKFNQKVSTQSVTKQQQQLVQPFKHLSHLDSPPSEKDQQLLYKQSWAEGQSGSFGYQDLLEQNHLDSFQDFLSASSKTFGHAGIITDRLDDFESPYTLQGISSHQEEDRLHPRNLQQSSEASEAYEQWSSRIRNKVQSKTSECKVPELHFKLSRATMSPVPVPTAAYVKNKKWKAKREQKLAEKRSQLYAKQHQQYKSAPFLFTRKRSTHDYMKPKEQLDFSTYYQHTCTFHPTIPHDQIYTRQAAKVDAKDKTLAQIVQERSREVQEERDVKVRQKRRRPAFRV